MSTHPPSQNLFAITILSVAVVVVPANAQTPKKNAHVRPIVGSRMVVGDGELANYTVKCFLHLCRNASPNVVVIRLDGQPRLAEAKLKMLGAESVAIMKSVPSELSRLALQLLEADGVWLEGNVEAVEENEMLLSLLKNITRRNGVIAVDSAGVSLLTQLDDKIPTKRVASPFAKCDFHFGKVSSAPKHQSAVEQQKVHFNIPDSSTLVIHSGRRIAGYGSQDIGVMVHGANGWPQRRGTFECPDVFSLNSYPFYGLDLLSWIRSANDRERPVFPPKTSREPDVKNGTLFLHGGSGVPKHVMEEFLRLAGGEKASIVCIPSAPQFDWSEEVDSYSAGLISELGHSKVAILHTDDPFEAEESEKFARILNEATGVWIDGGRTYRFMDCYQGTRVEKLIAQVLMRGGVVGGSSAGCQVPSDFLVRGNPRTNRDIAHAGYTRGMGLLKGVIIDAHFLQRGRHEPFLELMKRYPQLLGIGIDERTALIVQGRKAKVIGPHAVSFYDLKLENQDEFEPVILKTGETYDLKSRRKSQ